MGRAKRWAPPRFDLDPAKQEAPCLESAASRSTATDVPRRTLMGASIEVLAPEIAPLGYAWPPAGALDRTSFRSPLCAEGRMPRRPSAFGCVSSSFLRAGCRGIGASSTPVSEAGDWVQIDERATIDSSQNLAPGIPGAFGTCSLSIATGFISLPSELKEHRTLSGPVRLVEPCCFARQLRRNCMSYQVLPVAGSTAHGGEGGKPPGELARRQEHWFESSQAHLDSQAPR
jgi:hypothetical protein